MPQVFFVQYEVRPLPDNEDFSTAGGAYVNCYVVAVSPEAALKRARSNLAENSWDVVGVEEGPVLTSRERYLDDAETLEAFDEAVSNGECYVYHLWPIEPQDDDPIH
jgi:hypothetical protein